MAALWNRAGHYIFVLWFLSSMFFYLLSSSILYLLLFSSPDLSGHTWCGPNTNLECRSETSCARLTEMEDPKNRQKLAISAPSHNFDGLYLRN